MNRGIIYRKTKRPLGNIDTALVTQAFLDAFRSREAPSHLVLHSDQGTQYTSFEFCNLLKQLKVTQSFSAPGSPHDNAVAESFFASIKKEDFRRNYYKTEKNSAQRWRNTLSSITTIGLISGLVF